MKITLEINDIDYGALAELFLPTLHESLEKQDDAGAAILAKLAGMPPALAGKMINMLPKKTKDEIAVMLVNKNKGKVVESVTEYAQKMGVSFRIDDLYVE